MNFDVEFEILSPVHIGDGQEMDLFSYVIRNQRLHRISFGKLLRTMDNSEVVEFEKLIESGDILDLRQFISQHRHLSRCIIYSIDIHPEILALHETNLKNRHNQMLIHPFQRSGQLPLIPGSSLKGAFRTAFLSCSALRKNVKPPRGFKEESNFEKYILHCRDAKSDPFRKIKIRDTYLKPHDTVVQRIKNTGNKKQKEENSIQLFFETTHSQLTGKETHFNTRIYFDEKYAKSRFFNTEITKESLIEACCSFYSQKAAYEHELFFKGKENEVVSNKIMNTTLKDNECLIRVGRFSGVESVTLDKYRNPRPPGKKNVWGTTRNWAEGFYPMGWLKASFGPARKDLVNNEK